MTITQTVEIPADRRVHLDFEVPLEVPTGQTSIILQFPDRKREKYKTVEEAHASLERIRAILRDAPVLCNESFEEMRRHDFELEQAKHRRLHGEGN